MKKLFVFEINASEFVAPNCLCEADNACHRQSMCQETVLGFCVLVKETFSIATTFKLFNKYSRGAVLQIGTLFWPICHVVCLRVL